MGLVGPNGAGKTTLLRVLMGETEFDAGAIERSRNLTVGYLPQDLVELSPVPAMELLKAKVGLADLERRLREVEAKLARSDPHSGALPALLDEHARLERLFEHLGGFGFEAQALKVMAGLGFAPEDAERNCAEFSGGWKMRLTIAALLLSRPDVLLLDEPTNHLDTESMEWLEGWLRGHPGAIVVVSHDRRFLENMTEQTAELERGRLTLYPFSYERYLVEKETGQALLEKRVEEQKKRVSEIERFVERFRYKSSKAAQVQSRVRMLEKMKTLELDGPTRTVRLRIPEAPNSGWEVLKVQDLAKVYGEKKVFDGVDFTITRGERVALVGVNGAGKSTLMRLISETEAPTSGSVRMGHNVCPAFYSQESSLNL
ncbi:MAG: ABC-F family ATP-binding cassette domain-containing protein, partial [Fretibacterium sp.]|nr:ABC-F family ATP-binding cassette domain-containing protein [Fretibacterium sp.]